MTISKIPLLMILMMFCLQANVSSEDSYGKLDDSKKQTQYMLTIAHNWQKQDNPDTKIAGKWLKNKLVSNRLYSYWNTLLAILTNDKLELSEKVAYILEVKEQCEKERAKKKSEKVLREKEDFKRNIIHTATGFGVLIISMPFLFAGARIGDGFGKYIREQAWPNLDVDKSGWN